MAAKAGKDIYCEKPLSLTIRQGQAMVKAVRAAQARSCRPAAISAPSPTARHACELVRNGRIGQVKRIVTDVAAQQRHRPRAGLEADARARGFRLRDVARPGARGPVSHRPLLLPLPFHPRLLGRADDQFRLPLQRLVPMGPGHRRQRAGRVRGPRLRVARPRAACSPRPRRSPSAPAMPTAWNCCAGPAKPGFGVRFEGTEGWVDYCWKGLEDLPRVARRLAKSARTRSICR